jgi:CheY-like chemotaxis protein
VTGDVLVVDDNPVNVRRLAELLKAAGLSVRVAMSGARALDAIRAQMPDLVLLDVELPDRSGFEVSAELAASPATADLRVVFVSAHDGPIERARAFRAGGIARLRKENAALEARLDGRDTR